MATLKEGIEWFKGQFKDEIQNGIKGTPFSVDLLTSIAAQETFYIWGRVYTKLAKAEVLALCASDIIDESGGRSAFPKDKDELLKAPKGEEMFLIARDALVNLGKHLPEFKKYSTDAYPKKFCRGYGIFQYDLQFYPNNPNFFLEKKWYDFNQCLKLAVDELKGFQSKYYPNKNSLTDEEKVYVAIAYNKGSVKKNGGFKQGHKSDGKHYGENVWEYLQLSKSIP